MISVLRYKSDLTHLLLQEGTFSFSFLFFLFFFMEMETQWESIKQRFSLSVQ